MNVDRALSGTHPIGHAALDDAQQALLLERYYADATDALLGALRRSEASAEIWPALLGVFRTAVGAGTARLWLHKQGALSPHLAFGVDDSQAPASLDLAEAFGGGTSDDWPTVSLLAGAQPLLAGLDAVVDGQALRVLLRSRTGLVAVLCLACLERPVPKDRELERLTALAEHAGAALAECAAREQLQHSLEARDGMLSVVAHDLRNPLNVITTASSMLLDREPDTRTRRPLERILHAAHRAEHLLDDLLDVSAIESGHFSIVKRPFDTAATVLAAIESQQGLAANSSVILASDLAPGLPAVVADGERMLEVLENLVGNAVKFTPAGGSIVIGARDQEGELLLWVKDTGCGIPTEQQPRLFDRFWQASKSDRRGTGLGLTICRAIVDAHGGRIWVESAPGLGTTVSFTLPYAERVEQPEAHEATSILLVDDRRENLISLKAVLERPDYRLVTALSGEEALRCVLRERFAVVLMDIAMPGMDGLEVAEHLKALERSRDVPIIFITAFGDDPAEIHRAYSAGGADYLVKPLDPEIVRRKVAVFVDLSRRRNAPARSMGGA
jgi:signal transduction histidine kinase/CheY-like chemotaxis protein